jgi:lysozyme
MKTGSAGIALIKAFEGYSPTIYLCPAGKPTIGYGHVVCAEDHFTSSITEAEASELLIKDLVSRETAVSEMIKIPINQNQFDALISFAYNLGISALRGSTLLRYLNSRKFDMAAGEFLKWNKATVKGQMVTLAGLAKRRKAEKDLFIKAA